MENGTWRFGFSTPSSKYDYSDDYVDDYDENEEEDYDIEGDYSCPFCIETYDIIGLFRHIEEEHYEEAQKGVCPMCETVVGIDLVEHIALRHENVYKSESKFDAESQSMIAMIRKELLDRSLTSLLGSSSSVTSSSNAAVDQLLTSFICGYSTPAEVETKSFASTADTSFKEESTDESVLERSMKNCIISEEQEEQIQRSKFVQSLLLSTFLDDGL